MWFLEAAEGVTRGQQVPPQQALTAMPVLKTGSHYGVRVGLLLSNPPALVSCVWCLCYDLE